ncbi:Vacuolar protein-sorting-associated protein 27 [Perkinsus olseni]|uniref:Vacuolar protein-sorting-associated protein 27 n=1 Tax=Perkinsus olseni TaxID=32597 RepID=A0A7J6PAQ2_PEROL|nr:Vacuolar protein-sorting-associated protein 27 [Perkinsus olseni]
MASAVVASQNGKRDEAELVDQAIKEALDRTSQSHSPPTPSSSLVSQISDAVDMSNDSGRAVISELRRKITTHESSRIQWAALLLLDEVMQHTEVTFHLNIADTEFLTSLSKVLQRPDCDAEVKSTILRLASEWAVRFARDADILPNFQSFYIRLQDEGFNMPGVAKATPVATAATLVDNGNDNQASNRNLMDITYEQDAEGQDPETFIPEVQQTIELWNECFTKAKKETTPDVSTNEALISLAGNLDRYSIQLQLWIELLEPGEMMDTAISLNSEVLKALDDFRAFRARAA